jgi:hypothetical protein
MAIDKITASGLGDGGVSTADIADGAVTAAKLDSAAVTPTAVSDTDNTSTGQFVLPEGTTAQRPASPYSGSQRFNTDLSVMEYYNGSSWQKISPQIATLTSVTGNIYAGVLGLGVLTLAGEGFLSASLVVNFSQVADSINANVTVTPSSDTAATVNIPSAVYSNVTAGNVVTIKVTNSDFSMSGNIYKTAIALPSGGTITTSGDYKIHTFTSSGTFTNTVSNLSVEYLVIAGGGGVGARRHAAGGGAGGYRTNVTGQTSGRGSSAESSLTLSTGSKTVTIGAGGASSPELDNSNTGANNGSNSVFDTITSLGGGWGSAYNGGSGNSGGCGGGSGSRNSPAAAGGSGTAGQGYDGGAGQANTGGGAGGGGGGAGAAGAQGASTGSENGGNGGNGQSSTITGSAVTRAGGGGGGGSTSATRGSGGTGGGGDGANSTQTPQSGTANTGGGAGAGGAETDYGQTGGSGIVIVRYDATAI